MRHLIDITDLTTQEIDELISVAEDIIAEPGVTRRCAATKSWPPSF